MFVLSKTKKSIIWDFVLLSDSAVKLLQSLPGTNKPAYIFCKYMYDGILPDICLDFSPGFPLLAIYYKPVTKTTNLQDIADAATNIYLYIYDISTCRQQAQLVK